MKKVYLTLLILTFIIFVYCSFFIVENDIQGLITGISFGFILGYLIFKLI